MMPPGAAAQSPQPNAMPNAGSPANAGQSGQLPPGAGQSPAGQAVGMINQGIQTLAKLMASAGNIVTPEDKKLFNDLTNTFQALVSSLSQGQAQPAQGQAQAAPVPRGSGMPMAAHANAKAKPTQY